MSAAWARLIRSVSPAGSGSVTIDDTDTNPANWLACEADQAWFLRCFFVPRFAIVEGELVLGVAAFPATCCSEASANILFSFFRRPRNAGVFFISSRFWSGFPANPVCCPRGFGGIPALCWSLTAIPLILPFTRPFSPQRPLQRDRRNQCCDDNHDNNGAENRRANHGNVFARRQWQHQRRTDARED